MKELNYFEALLLRSSSLVKKWGDSILPNGGSLKDLLSIEGLSLWDAMAAELALYLIPDGLSVRKKRKTIRQVLIPFLRPVKYAFWRPSELNFKDCKLWPPGKTALFVGFCDYMAHDVLHPVMDLLLRDEAGITPVLLIDKLGRHSDVKYVHSTNCHRTQYCINESIKLRKLILKKTTQLLNQKESQDIFSENNISLWSRLKFGFKRAFGVYASYFLPDIIAVARHILHEHRPSIIISIDTADPRTRIYSLLGKKLGIPTIQVQAGAVGPEAVEWRFLLDDLVLTQGEQSKNFLISHGVPESKILVTGSPRYDYPSEIRDNQTQKTKERFKITENSRIILLASSYSLEIFENYLENTSNLLLEMKKAVFLAASQFSGLTLIVKPHPIENVDETKRLAVGIENIIFSSKEEDIRPLISGCDGFITFGSTATLDGLILGKPTICPAFPGWIISDNFIKTGAVPAPRSELDIADLFREIMADGGENIIRSHNEKRVAYLNEVIFNGRNGASQEIVDLIKKYT